MTRRVLWLLILSIALTSNVLAVSATGPASGGTAAACNSCHSNQLLQVAFSTTSSKLYPGQSATFAVNIDKWTAGLDPARVGLNVAATGGTLSVSPTDPLTIVSNQVVHSTFGDTRPLHTFAASTSTSYQFNYTMPTSATPGTSYILKAVCAAGVPGAPELGTADTTGMNLTVTAVLPSRPFGLTATSVTSGSITLNWSGTGPAYRVLYKTTGFPSGPTDPSAFTIDQTPASVTLGLLPPNTTYYFAVYARASFTVTTYSVAPALLAVTTTNAAPTNYYVNASTGSDPNNGTTATPWRTITHALTVATSGDTVNVARGLYNAAIGETFPIILRTGVRIIGTSGAAATIVDATGANQRIFSCFTAGGNTIVEGLTIKGGVNLTATNGITNGGGGVYCTTNCFATFRRNIITGNEARSLSGASAYGGGVFVERGVPVLENNIIANNIARGGAGADLDFGGQGGFAYGGGMSVMGSPDVMIVNNTVYGNLALAGKGGGTNASTQGGAGGIARAGGINGFSNRIFNNIIVANRAIAGAGGLGVTRGTPGTSGDGGLSSGSTDVTSNNLFSANTPDNATYPGTAAVFADPKFGDGALADFHVTIVSPARGAGTPTGAPAVDLENTPRATPPTIGALEGLPADHVEFHGDFNGDGKDDVLLRYLPSGAIGMWLMNGTIISSGAYVSSAPTSLNIAGVADFDGDGKADILFRDPVSGDIGMWLMNGPTIIAGAYVGVVDPLVEIAGFGDFNGDGRADILFLQPASGALAIWFMNGPTIIGGGSLPTVSPLLGIVGVGDFNGDGKDDILWRHRGTGDVAIWMMNGLNIVSGGLVGAADPLLSVAGVGDYNGDAKADVLWRHADGDVAIWLMNGIVISSGGLVGTSPGDLRIASTGDYNGDGKADVLFAGTAGDVGMWLMNGIVIIDGALVSSAGPGYEFH